MHCIDMMDELNCVVYYVHTYLHRVHLPLVLNIGSCT